MKKFIKVVDRSVAESLFTQGFQYIKERNSFVFTYSEKLMAVLQKSFAASKFVIEDKLRF